MAFLGYFRQQERTHMSDIRPHFDIQRDPEVAEDIVIPQTQFETTTFPGREKES